MGRERIISPHQVARRGFTTTPTTHESSASVLRGPEHPSGLEFLPKQLSSDEPTDEKPSHVCIRDGDALDVIGKAIGGIVDRDGAAGSGPPKS